MVNPYQSPEAAREWAAGRPLPPQPGAPSAWVGHVRWVAGLMIAQGILEFAAAGFCGALAAGFPLLIFKAGEEVQIEERGVWFIVAVYASLGALHLVMAVLHVLAGISNLRYRRRTLGLVAMFSGFASVAFVCCAPTAIGIAVYGLIVYFQEPVMRAFALGDEGYTVPQIRQTLG